ncbi:MAG: hypothetical protein WAW36_11745, partial [Methylovulum miyakonense]|uniref:hypothetical protein n=1 Tax=Methylovulum miyakonense TaxID=645578 RepID=UPI003BB5D661
SPAFGQVHREKPSGSGMSETAVFGHGLNGAMFLERCGSYLTASYVLHELSLIGIVTDVRP